MPAKPRDAAPGVHHIWINATSHWEYFLDHVDRVAWVRLFARVCDRLCWNPLAFCQMTTHVHGLIEVPDTSLSTGMEYLNREYSKDFNARHGRSGHLVRKRFGSRRAEGAHDLIGTYAYVVLNPVEAGICTRAEDWRWSSYATTAGFSHDFTFVNPRLVLAELADSVLALRNLIDARAAEIVRRRQVR